MIQAMTWTQMWAISGGAPFRWTATINGLNGQPVVAEASLVKVVLDNTSGGKHAKATVWSAQRFGGTADRPQPLDLWGIDGWAIQYLGNHSHMTFALEVSGSGTYAMMTGKLFFV